MHADTAAQLRAAILRTEAISARVPYLDCENNTTRDSLTERFKASMIAGDIASQMILVKVALEQLLAVVHYVRQNLRACIHTDIHVYILLGNALT
jgi:hypothetical protein